MKKGNGKKTLRAVLAAALGTVMLMSLAWAGVTDVTGGSKTIVNTTVENVYTDTYDRRSFALTKGENTFADAGRYFGAGGTMTVRFSGLDTPVSITYSVANDVVTMTVDNYDQLPDGVYSSEYREQKDKMTTTYTGSKLTYNGTDTDYEEDGSTVTRINETRTDYYTRNHVMVAFTLTVGDAPVVPSSGSSYSGPYITPLLTAPDAKSATDYSGGIYGLTFKSSAGFPSFQGVQVDGKTIDKSCYIAEEGSIEVYLKAVYLRTLAAGKHTVTILSSQGNTTAEFTIGGLNTAPKTFDAGVAVYGVTAVLSLGGMAWMGKKKAH
mgnify:CR=1 FL=1